LPTTQAIMPIKGSKDADFHLVLPGFCKIQTRRLSAF